MGGGHNHLYTRRLHFLKSFKCEVCFVAMYKQENAFMTVAGWLCFSYECCFHPLQQDFSRGPPVRRSFRCHWTLCLKEHVPPYFFGVPQECWFCGLTLCIDSNNGCDVLPLPATAPSHRFSSLPYSNTLPHSGDLVKKP